MKKSMPEYLSAMSENDFDVLEEIIDDKFKKFKMFYWLIRDFSDNVTHLKYKKTNKHTLKIELEFSGITSNDVLDKLSDYINEHNNISAFIDDDILKIEIDKNEDVA